MGSILEKLGSFDADMRFMGLEDLDESLVAAAPAALPAALVHKAVSLVGDPNYSVQSRAAKVVGSLASVVSPAALTKMLLEAPLGHHQQGLALKRVFQNISTTTPFGDASPPFPLTASLASHAELFTSTEGCDAVYEYAQHMDPGHHGDAHNLGAQTEAERITRFYLLDHKPPAFSHGYDLLALTIPRVGRAVWEAGVLPVLRANLSRAPECLTMLSKMAAHPRAFELALEVERIAANPDHEGNAELALRIMAVFTRAHPETAGRYAALAKRLLTYRSGDAPVDAPADTSADDDRDDADALYADMDPDEWDEGFEDGFYSDGEDQEDLSSAVRVAAAQLAAATGSHAMVTTLAAALAKESADTVRQAMYQALQDLMNPGECTESLLIPLKNAVLRDIGKSRTNQAKIAGIALFAHLNHWQSVSELVSAEVAKFQGVNVPHLVATLGDIANAGPTDPENRAHLTAAMTALLGTLGPATPNETNLMLLALVQRAHLTALLDLVVHISQEPAATRPTKTAAILCAASLVGPTTPPATIDEIARQCREMLDDNKLIPAALTALDALPRIGADYAAPISRKIEAALLGATNNPSQASATTTSSQAAGLALSDADVQRAYDLLFKLPVAYRESIETILRDQRDAKIVEKVFRDNMPKSIEFPVVMWAVDHNVLGLISDMAARDPRVLTWVFDRKIPAVHAAAARGAAQLPGHGKTWVSLSDAHYHFTATSFSDLSPDQLEFLTLLSDHEMAINEWYNVDQMIAALNRSNAHEKQQAVLLGKQVALTGGSQPDVTRVFEQITNEENRTMAFQAYVDSLADAEIAFNILHQNPWLRENYTGNASIRDAETAERFSLMFKDDPRFVISTARYLDTRVVVGMTPVLARFVRGEFSGDAGTHRHVRAQALSIMKCTVAKDRDGINQLLATINAVLQPDPSFVKDVMIGPFKMKVDDLDPAREEALDCLSVCVSPVADPQLLGEAVSLVISHRLQDNVQKTRLMAYRWLLSLVDLDFGRPMVVSHAEVLNDRIAKQLATPPKDNTASWTLQEAKDLQLAAEQLRLAILP